MIRKKEINIENWKRKKQYEFYKDYEIPFFNITANIEITNLYSFCKKNKLSFFLSSLYFSTKTVNSIEEFKFRIEKDKIFYYNTIHAGSTILHEDKSFSFCYFDYMENLQNFCKAGEKKINLQNKTQDLKASEENNVIHYSIIPWISFTSFSHARKFDKNDSIPKIVFGKFFEETQGKKLMPVSVEVHHALIDGYHVGEYFRLFQENISKL